MRANRKERITDLISDVRRFRFCGPSDDPDEQTAVTTGYRYLVIQLKRLAAPVLPEAEAARLNSIEVEIDNLYSAYDAKSELDALLLDIEDSIEALGDDGNSPGANRWIVNPDLVVQLAELESTRVDMTFLVRVCKEINSSYAHGNVLATALMMRTVLNHVPPVFGQETFAQVVANIGRSLKENFDHLENGLRKIADFHAHRKAAGLVPYPSVAQIEPFKPQFELLLQQVSSLLKEDE